MEITKIPGTTEKTLVIIGQLVPLLGGVYKLTSAFSEEFEGVLKQTV